MMIEIGIFLERYFCVVICMACLIESHLQINSPEKTLPAYLHDLFFLPRRESVYPKKRDLGNCDARANWSAGNQPISNLIVRMPGRCQNVG